MSDLDRLLVDLTSGDDDRAESALIPLSEIGEKALYSLLELIQAPVADHRWWATRALSLFDDPIASEGLVFSLDDPESAVRHCAALSLRETPSERAISPLIRVLKSDDPLLSRLASDALCAIGAAAIFSLEGAAKSNSPAVQIGAVRALATMEDPLAIPALFSAVDDPSPVVNYWAEHGLNRLGVGMVLFKP